MSKLEPRDYVYLSNFQRLVKVQVEPHRCVLWFDDGSLITVQSVWRRGPGDPSLGVAIEQAGVRPGQPMQASFSRETVAAYQCSCGFPCRGAGKACPQCGDPGLTQDGQPGAVSPEQVRFELDQPPAPTGQSETGAGREVGTSDAAKAGRPVDDADGSNWRRNPTGLGWRWIDPADPD